MESIPEHECLIAPIPDLTFIAHGAEEVNKKAFPFTILMKHNVSNKSHLGHIRVRHGDIHKGIAFQLIPRKGEFSKESTLPESYWEADEKYIKITTTHFSQFICTSRRKTCDDKLQAFVYGNIKECGQNNIADIKLFLCPSLYQIMDYKTVSLVVAILPFKSKHPFIRAITM